MKNGNNSEHGRDAMLDPFIIDKIREEEERRRREQERQQPHVPADDPREIPEEKPKDEGDEKNGGVETWDI